MGIIYSIHIGVGLGNIERNLGKTGILGVLGDFNEGHFIDREERTQKKLVGHSPN